MHTARIRARVPSATPVAIGYLEQHAFVYHKRSIDGSAKADAAFTGRATDRIWGVVFELHHAEKPVLDEHEFLGIGYDEREIDVVVDDGEIRAWMYVARQEVTDPSLLPYSWYHDFVIHGAQQHGLPREYIDHLQSHQSIIDPDPARHEQNRRLIIP
jgi:gamma-glutamylcyclotransferase (GGCT)/AIG2-like uncharacterized protein YtfP